MARRYRIGRMIAFYLSVALFLLLLPIVLSYSLGYHIDFQALKIYKTGIIYLKSQPSGASICINGKMLSDVTPARIEELKPGTYRVEVRRDGFYPWQKDIVVRPNMVTKVDDIVLFRLTQEMKRLSDHEVVSFALSKGNIYLMTRDGLFKSNIDGTNLKRLSLYSNWPGDIIGKRFSPDGDKLLYFNEFYIWAIYLNPDRSLAKNGENAKVEEILKSPNPIIDVFWFSESKHIVYVTDQDINVVELGGVGQERNIVTLYKFNSTPKGIYYDESSDSLYFTDLKGQPDSSQTSYLYRLDLRQKFFDRVMQRLKKEFDIIYEER